MGISARSHHQAGRRREATQGAISRCGRRFPGRAVKQIPCAAGRGFLASIRERPFFDELCTFMTRGPVVVVALERENAVQHYRDVIGATDPAKAADNTVRKLYGSNVGENAVHGSDSEENGRIECGYFFDGQELI